MSKTIRVAGQTERAFTFPSNLFTAYDYYTHPTQLLEHLPYITVVKTYSQDCFQVMYERVELGSYRIRILADVRFLFDHARRTIQVTPLKGKSPAKAKAGLNISTAPGIFSSRSSFYPEDDQTQIIYQVQLHANLPAPLALRLMPGMVIDGIANQITNYRIREIADGFIERSIEAFRWQAVAI